jgi:hypothetical protein
MKAEYKKHLPYLVFIAAALFLGFSSAILHVYIFHDDIFLWQEPGSPDKFPSICSLTFFVGRFIGAYILWPYFLLVKSVTDLNKVRLITSLVIAVCAMGSYGVILKYLKRPIDAALCAVMLFSLPAFEVWTSHAVQSYEVYALIFVILAVYSVDRMPLEGRFWKRSAGNAGLITIFWLICSWMVYPSAAVFYWTMAAVLLIAQWENDSKLLRPKIENVYLPGIMAILLYACIYKLKKYFIHSYFVNKYQPDMLTSHVIDKLIWFFRSVIPQSLNLWNIFPNNSVTAFLSLFLAGAVLITLIKEWQAGKGRDLGIKISLGILTVSSLVILSYLPNLLCAVNFNPYRCGAGLTALFIFFLVWALRTYSQYIPGSARANVITLILAVVCAWGVYRCYDNIDRFRAKPSHLEYSFIRDSIKNFHGNIKEIYLIPPRASDLYHYYDEFGVSTFSFDYYSNVVNLINAYIVDASAQNGMEWTGFKRIASPEELKLTGPDFYWNNSTYKYSFAGKTSDNKTIHPFLELKISVSESKNASLAASTLVIDMNDLYRPLKEIMGHDQAKSFNF